MATYAKLLNGLTDLGIHKMQEHLDYYIDLVNKGQKSFSDALEELIDIEKKNNQLRAESACVKTANFPFIKTLDDFEFDFQPGSNRKEMLELGNLGFIDRKENILFVGSSGFRVIIVTVANSLGNIRVFELLPKLKTKKYGWCIA